jgi:hypothetical protein
VHVSDHAHLVLGQRDTRDRVTHECAEIDVRETVGERAGIDP